jgi:hypothetical protein
LKRAEKIYDKIGRILEISAKKNIPTHEASNQIAEERLRSVGRISNIYTGKSSFSGRLDELFQK